MHDAFAWQLWTALIKTHAAFGIQMLRESVDEPDDLAPWGGGTGRLGVLDVFPGGLVDCAKMLSVILGRRLF